MHILDQDGYVILDSISYGNIFKKSKQDHHLLVNLSGTLKNGIVDNASMSWKSVEYANSCSNTIGNQLSKRRKKEEIPLCLPYLQLQMLLIGSILTMFIKLS